MSENEGIARLERGEDPNLLLRMRSGWAVIGETQHLPGYSLLIHPTADHLTDLAPAERSDFLLDMSLLGEAIARVCGAADPAFRRVNYEILGNTWNHLHAHLHPRYGWEPAERRGLPVWLYGAERMADSHLVGVGHRALQAELAAALGEIAGAAYR